MSRDRVEEARAQIQRSERERRVEREERKFLQALQEQPKQA